MCHEMWWGRVWVGRAAMVRCHPAELPVPGGVLLVRGSRIRSEEPASAWGWQWWGLGGVVWDKVVHRGAESWAEGVFEVGLFEAACGAGLIFRTPVNLFRTSPIARLRAAHSASTALAHHPCPNSGGNAVAPVRPPGLEPGTH